jgi:hypothetical protein
MSQKIVQATATPVEGKPQQVLNCPICGTDSYMLLDLFEEGDSYFCPNRKCGWWLVIPNEKCERAENEKKRRLDNLNERRRVQSKKWQREKFVQENQAEIFEEKL